MPMPAFASVNCPLQEINSRLQFWIDTLAGVGSQRSVANPKQIAGILAELMRAGQWLRTLPNRNLPELQTEIEAYRRNVERLRNLLPSIHSGLLRERARLEQERARIASAREWVRRSRETW